MLRRVDRRAGPSVHTLEVGASLPRSSSRSFLRLLQLAPAPLAMPRIVLEPVVGLALGDLPESHPAITADERPLRAKPSPCSLHDSLRTRKVRGSQVGPWRPPRRRGERSPTNRALTRAGPPTLGRPGMPAVVVDRLEVGRAARTSTREGLRKRSVDVHLCRRSLRTPGPSRIRERSHPLLLRVH